MNTAELLNARRDTSRTEREQVLDAMQKAGHGSTILELEFMTGIRSSTVIARLHEAIKAGDVVIAPFRRHCMVNDITKKVYALAPPKKPHRVIEGQTSFLEVTA